MTYLRSAAGVTGLVFAAAIFGFFYAWVCSTMWGLDAADPRTAIAAMQAMNASVRNAVFAPAFFGTGPVLIAVGLICAGQVRWWFVAAGVVYVLFGMGLTLAVNVPMNEALAATPVPSDIDAAGAIWAAYSPRWQLFNVLRTLASGLSVILAGIGLTRL